MLPDAFFALDGLFETLLTVLDQMDAYPAVIGRENDHYLPFLMTTTIMMEAVKAGVGRETAHHVIKEHAVAAVNDLRSGKREQNDLLERLADDDRLPLDRGALDAIVEAGRANAGAAGAQIRHFRDAVGILARAHPDAADYQPGGIL
jgi:adenylosuccinate lyase